MENITLQVEQYTKDNSTRRGTFAAMASYITPMGKFVIRGAGSTIHSTVSEC